MMFRKKFEEVQAKQALLKHMWSMWPHQVTNHALHSVWLNLVIDYQKHKPKISANNFHLKYLGLTDLAGVMLIKLLLRYSCWMIHFGMEQSTMFQLFLTRMDVYVCSIRPKESTITFSSAVRDITHDKDQFMLWIWNIRHTPVNVMHTPVWQLMGVWRQHRKHSRLFESLSLSVQSMLLMMACFTNLYGCRCNCVTLKAQTSVSMVMDFLHGNSVIVL